ncbi:MAG: HAD hydrolase-like protein [Spirochaetia bacterium]
MSDIKLIIFDLDGTLVDSLDDLTDATNYMLKGFGRGELTRREVRLLVGQGATRLVSGPCLAPHPTRSRRGCGCSSPTTISTSPTGRGSIQG